MEKDKTVINGREVVRADNVVCRVYFFKSIYAQSTVMVDMVKHNKYVELFLAQLRRKHLSTLFIFLIQVMALPLSVTVFWSANVIVKGGPK